ncbi:MAG: FHA domain-containing protein [Lachnospiraceae bacterium]|nr:FHA domain-containing protein [Lachnospiraceae bacterium]
MDRIISFLLSNEAVCFYEVALLGFVSARFFRLKKEKKQAVEMSALQKEKAREGQLDQVLKNRLYQGLPTKAFQNNIPYEVSFHEESGLLGSSDDSIAVQIIEKGKLSTRKYVIFISEVITVGNSSTNVLVLNDINVAKEQCRIFKHQQSLYIQTLEDTHPVKIRRKREEMQLSQNAVKLLDNDYIEIGETSLNIHFV